LYIPNFSKYKVEAVVFRVPEPSDSKLIMSPLGLGIKNHCAGKDQQLQ
jgi:hypothetical protein